MEVEEATAQWTSEYKGQTYYFCAPGCKVSFDGDPEKYLNGGDAEHSHAAGDHAAHAGNDHSMHAGHGHAADGHAADGHAADGHAASDPSSGNHR
jgi:YHS domain-containing protein